MFDCVMCKNPEQSCYRASLCSKCEETKKIVAIYGIDRVNEALLEIFVREERPIKNRVEAIATRALVPKKKEKPPLI